MDVAEGHYSAHLLHFACLHWEELESRKEDIRREYLLLGDGELCLCGTKWAVGGESARGGQHSRDGISVSTLQLDVRRAYDALPMTWRGRTVVYLHIELGWTDARIHESMARCRPCTQHQLADCIHNEFSARHRRRIVLETLGQSARPQDRLPERQSPWTYMAEFLHPLADRAQCDACQRAERRAA